VTNLFNEEKSHELSNEGEAGRDGAAEEVRIFFQEISVARQAAESLRRTGKCSSDNRSVPNPSS